MNEHKEAGSCGEIARQLIKTGSHPDQLIRFYRGSTKVFNQDFTLAYWAGTALEESAKGEWMKVVPYRGDFQLRMPTEKPQKVRRTGLYHKIDFVTVQRLQYLFHTTYSAVLWAQNKSKASTSDGSQKDLRSKGKLLISMLQYFSVGSTGAG